MVVKFKGKGSFTNCQKILEQWKNLSHSGALDRVGKLGVEALLEYTPKDTGKTSRSWSYEIKYNNKGPVIYWKNDNIDDGVLVALVIQTGHVSMYGNWVEGRDYINPAIQSRYEEMMMEIKKVTG